MTPLRRIATAFFLLALHSAFAAEAPGLWWAYGETKAPAPGEKATLGAPSALGLRSDLDAAEQTRPRRVPGSERTFSLVEIRNRRDVVDWFPGDHPPMPEIIRRGPVALGDNGYGCALCHMPSGKGRPENAPVNGLPVAYFVRQLEDFSSGARASSDPRKANTLRMIELARAMTPAEMKAAAEYYAALPPTPWVRVVETDFVPKTRVAPAKFFVATETERTEPIGARIIEVPEDFGQFENANPRSGLLAYVPTGSIRRGEALAKAGDATVVAGQPPAGKVSCMACHGPDLRGGADIPGIAGRSPSYLARQLQDFQRGTRKGPLAAVMQPAVASLTNDDILALVAYASSLSPGAPTAATGEKH